MAEILEEFEVRQWFQQLPLEDFEQKKVLLIVPDYTRTAPLALLFDSLFKRIRPVVAQLDVIFALGTHPPMSEVQMCNLLGIEDKERTRLFYQTQLINHEWDRPERLTTIEIGRAHV